VLPLESVAELRDVVDTDVIRRVDGRRTVTLNIVPPRPWRSRRRCSASSSSCCRRCVADGLVPPEMSRRGLRRRRPARCDARVAVGNFAIATLLSYLLLVAIFTHWGWPLMILASVPLGLAGGIFGLVLLNALGLRLPLDMITMLGFLILLGTVVNNPILVVDRTRELLRHRDDPVRGSAPGRGFAPAADPDDDADDSVRLGAAGDDPRRGRRALPWPGRGRAVRPAVLHVVTLTFLPAVLVELLQWRERAEQIIQCTGGHTMKSTVSRFALAVLAAAAITPVAAQDAQQSYIVVLRTGTADVPTVAAEISRAYGGRPGFIYEHALKGFSIRVSSQAAAAIASSPRVAYVERDMPRYIHAQKMPTGIGRIFADTNANLDIDGTDDFRVDVDVAVIDTGIDWQHPDLNVVGGINCASGNPFRASCSGNGDDDHYHGTHVAGTIAALDNGIGVVGVAPGARLWAVKVLNSQGSGYTSWIVAGIDWVAARASTIEVANMSLGGSGYSQAEYDAIQGAVNKGVAFAVSAGNSDADARNYSPAAFDNVLTVSALADFDGEPGGLGSPTCRTDQDDTLADFSNWGPAVDIAAPGVCILSTYPIERGEYGTISGTSMSSPHVAGAPGAAGEP
jgi:hypothetical protein